MIKSKNKRQATEDRKPIYAKKSFGQNFLVDPNYIDKIIHALDPQANETIIEIGAGRGALTGKLIESEANVVAVELEREMIANLREQFAGAENFRLIESDALKLNFEEIIENPLTANRKPQTAKLVANLPYYISTAILQKLIEQRDCFSEMILMFQREVVERITARAGDSERGFLTVLTEAYLDAEKLFDVPPNAFHPAPKVWSSIVRLKPKDNIEIENEDLFREIISAGFAQKRKTIFNNLKNAPNIFENKDEVLRVLEESKIEKNRRAETLTLEEWARLSNF
ncbi:MAG: 16S rRNA (adenine(1518)-N(6)/adenine(1519)-N(6))-dimethyltransferase RsmA [Pyrinomonadaceae bacterium]